MLHIYESRSNLMKSSRGRSAPCSLMVIMMACISGYAYNSIKTQKQTKKALLSTTPSIRKIKVMKSSPCVSTEYILAPDRLLSCFKTTPLHPYIQKKPSPTHQYTKLTMLNFVRPSMFPLNPPGALFCTGSPCYVPWRLASLVAVSTIAADNTMGVPFANFAFYLYRLGQQFPFFFLLCSLDQNMIQSVTIQFTYMFDCQYLHLTQ